MRTFIAIEIPEEVRARVRSLTARLQASGARGCTWVKPEHMHLTLRFLGEIADAAVEGLCSSLEASYSGVAPFALAVRGTGAFPNWRKPAVLWAGIEPLDGPLAEAQGVAESAARAIGLPPDTKAFHPHLTLARVKDARGAAPAIACLECESEFFAGDFTVDAVSIYSSQLTPHGPIYRRVGEFRF